MREILTHHEDNQLQDMRENNIRIKIKAHDSENKQHAPWKFSGVCCNVCSKLRHGEDLRNNFISITY